MGAELAPGTQIGRYTLIRRFAAGGMAELYLARAEGIHGFEKLCVLKRVLPHLARDRSFVEMFLQEARFAAGLDHPHVVHVSDIGELDGHPWFVMEYVHGRDLQSILYKIDYGTPMPLGPALAIASRVAAGLHYVHERTDSTGNPLGLVHRDVSPSNILVTYDGGVKIVDFGIVKATRRRAITRTGVLKGKAAYMAPEQCTGKPIDRRTDVFALGIVLFEMTTGRMLFDGETDFDIMTKIVEGRCPMPSSVIEGYPRALEAIVCKALATDMDARYETARDLQVALEAFVREHRIGASQVELEDFMVGAFGRPPMPTAFDDDDRPQDSPTRPEITTTTGEREPQSTAVDEAPAGSGRTQAYEDASSDARAVTADLARHGPGSSSDPELSPVTSSSPSLAVGLTATAVEPSPISSPVSTQPAPVVMPTGTHPSESLEDLEAWGRHPARGLAVLALVLFVLGGAGAVTYRWATSSGRTEATGTLESATPAAIIEAPSVQDPSGGNEETRPAARDPDEGAPPIQVAEPASVEGADIEDAEEAETKSETSKSSKRRKSGSRSRRRARSESTRSQSGSDSRPEPNLDAMYPTRKVD